jgi:hypothetical protein
MDFTDLCPGIPTNLVWDAKYSSFFQVKNTFLTVIPEALILAGEYRF